MDINPYEPPKSSIGPRQAGASFAVQISRAIVAVGGVFLAAYWALFALGSFPWIVPADHSSSYVEAYENASNAGVILALIAALNVLQALVWGRSYPRFIVALVLLLGVASVSPWLYPALKGMRLFSWRLTAQVCLAMIIVLGAVLFGFKRPEQEEPQYQAGLSLD